jgi:serine/tyrosine/threonine adenylyltransferase
MNTVADPGLQASLTSGVSPQAWRNRFARLGEPFFTPLLPTSLPSPHWVGRNAAIAAELGLDAEWFASDEALEVFTGNAVLPGMAPLASVYSGHQFGVWAGQLGDGRALLLGELSTPIGPQEVQLKGAGLTPYSRMGDGRAVLRSSIREYLCSEAMHGLGIPTTRALCVTGSPAPVQRETLETAAVVTRVAPSFIRFGHFEHFSANEQIAELRQLADFVIDSFYAEADADGDTGATLANRYAELLRRVCLRTARLMAQWQAVGFCHGVMNTDNMSILGLTIDYGPFGFLDGFDPNHICNHSDHQGRYAYARQPNVAYWNLFCLGQALMPLIEEQDAALAALEPFKTAFPQALDAQMRAKFGLFQPMEGDRALFEGLLRLMASERTDYTIAFRRLCDFGLGDSSRNSVRDLFRDREAFDAWATVYAARLAQDELANGADAATAARRRAAAMRRVNPRFVLRNHLAQACIDSANQGDFSEVERLQTLLADPFDEHPEFDAYAGFPPDWASSLEVSCSS